jgi:shikimate dehydrogenase
VLLPLLAQLPAEITIANRSVEKAQQLVALFAVHNEHAIHLSASSFAALDAQYDVIINATSAGLAAQIVPIPATVFAPGSLAYDMLYGARPSAFLQDAAAHGALIRDGLGMLVEQAAASFFWWRGVQPDTAPVLQALKQSLMVAG